MSNNTQWGGQWTGHQDRFSKKESGGNGDQNNWSGVAWGGQNTGQHSPDSYNGRIPTGYNGHIAPHSYSYNGQSSGSAYINNGQVCQQHNPNGQGWASSNIMTGQVTGYSGHGQPPGYMNTPPPYGKHKKVENVLNICLLGVYYVI